MKNNRARPDDRIVADLNGAKQNGVRADIHVISMIGQSAVPLLMPIVVQCRRAQLMPRTAASCTTSPSHEKAAGQIRS